MERTVPELPTNNTDLMPSERTKQLKMTKWHVIKNIPYKSLISSHSGSFFSVIKQKEYKRTLNQTDTDPSLKSPPPPQSLARPTNLNTVEDYLPPLGDRWG